MENWPTDAPSPTTFNARDIFDPRRLKSVVITLTNNNKQQWEKDCKDTSTQQQQHTGETAEIETEAPVGRVGISFIPFFFFLSHQPSPKQPNQAHPQTIWTSAQESVYFHQGPHHIKSPTGATVGYFGHNQDQHMHSGDQKNSSSWIQSPKCYGKGTSRQPVVFHSQGYGSDCEPI